MNPKIRKADATKVLDALRAQYPNDDPDAFTLKDDFDGHEWVILGEMGPHEWPYSFPEGNAQYDVPDVSVRVPGHLYPQAINHYSVALYRRPPVSPERAADLALRVNDRSWDEKDHTDWNNVHASITSEAALPYYIKYRTPDGNYTARFDTDERDAAVRLFRREDPSEMLISEHNLPIEWLR